MAATTFTSSHLLAVLRFKMDALAYSATVAVFGGGGLKAAMQIIRLLWVGNEFAQPVGATSKIVGVADNQWRKLFYGSVGGSLEQPCFVGGSGG